MARGTLLSRQSFSTRRCRALASFPLAGCPTRRFATSALAICSNVAFIIYGGVNCLVPVLVLHLLPLPLNVFRLKESKDERGSGLTQN